MAISERIHFFRLMRGMTQKYLGTAIGFPERVLMCVWHSTKLVHKTESRPYKCIGTGA